MHFINSNYVHPLARVQGKYSGRAHDHGYVGEDQELKKDNPH